MKLFFSPAFVGRDLELKQLDAALSAAQTGHGRCVLVSGEAGIGKSRLIAELRARAEESGFSILVGRCYDQDRAFPYAPLIDMLRTIASQGTITGPLDRLGPLAHDLDRLLPELADRITSPKPEPAPDAKVERRRLFEALSGLVLHQADGKPLLLVVEDLHWCDEATLDFLLFLVRHSAEKPILTLLSSRRAEAHAALLTLLVGLDREPIAQEIRLGPLSRSDVSQLLQALLGQPQAPSAEFVMAIYDLTEGNPFFTEEICSAMIANGDIYREGNQWRRKPLAQVEIPDSLQRLVETRLGRVSLPARQFIDLAAASGRSFDYPVLQSITGLNDEEMVAVIKELIAAGLVVEESADHFTFRHALTREAAYGHLLAREQRVLHKKLVEATEQNYAGFLEAHLEPLAYHTFEAAQWSKALDYARRAGARAQALNAPRAAIEQFSRAVTAAARLAVAPDWILFRQRGQAYDTLGEFDLARGDYETALNVAQDAGHREGAWQALLDLGLLWASRDYARTGEYCRQALDLARAMEEPAAVGHSLNRLGNWLMNSGRPLEALDFHREALELFEELEDLGGVAATLDLLAMNSNQAGDGQATVSYYQRAIPILRQLNDRQTLVSSLTNLSFYTLDEAVVREAIELAQQIDWPAGEAYAWEYLGQNLVYRGNYGAGLKAARRGLALAQAIDHRQWQAWGDIVLGLILAMLLAHEEAYRHFHRAKTLADEIGSSFMASFASGYLVSTCLALGRTEEVPGLLPESLPQPITISEYGRAKAMIEHALAQDPARALQLLDQLELQPALWVGGMAFHIGEFSLLRCEVLTRLNRTEEAEIGLLITRDRYERLGIRMGLWRVYLALGKAYQAGRKNEQAAEAYRVARAQVEMLAATVTDDHLRENFRRRAMGVIPPTPELTQAQTAKADYGGLTRREREVAAVVAQGLSNQDIADALVVSIKTVEAHVSRILSKLGFTSRAQIAAWAVDKGLADAPQDLDSLARGI